MSSESAPPTPANQLTAEISILHPITRLPLDILITVVGPDLEMKIFMHQKMLIWVQRQAARKRRKKGVKFYELTEAEKVSVLVSCTRGWRTLLRDENGKESGYRQEIEFHRGEWLPFSEDNVRRVYKDKDIPWLREQVDLGIGALMEGV